jgi:hypothetical protein
MWSIFAPALITAIGPGDIVGFGAAEKAGHGNVDTPFGDGVCGLFVVLSDALNGEKE